MKLSEDILTVDEAAEAIGRDRVYILKLIRKGKLPYIELSRKTRYILRQDLIEMLHSSRTEAQGA